MNRESIGPAQPPTWRRLFAFIGPAYLVAVGYVDPGNWATDLAGGSAFGYTLLSVILLSNLMAMLLQSLAAKLGIVTGRDLAQMCRDAYSPPTRIMLWLLCEGAIIACDLAEVIGTAIALQLLFGIPLVIGTIVTGFDVLIILALQQGGYRALETLVIALLAVVAGCFAVELALSAPSVSAIAGGLVPRAEIVTDPARLYLAIAIIGATVMPHNLYLHSSIIQRRAVGPTASAKREAIRFATIDTVVALGLALVLNAAILILAASTFHRAGMTGVAEIQEAYRLLTPIVGVGVASTLFATALLAAGQSSTLTATLAGQIVMEGFLDLKFAAWKRRLVTRLLALVPAVAVAAFAGVSGTAKLLVLSQVILSLQLPFAVVPLIRFTGDRGRMDEFANSIALNAVAWIVAALIIGLNAALLIRLF